MEEIGHTTRPTNLLHRLAAGDPTAHAAMITHTLTRIELKSERGRSCVPNFRHFLAGERIEVTMPTDDLLLDLLVAWEDARADGRMLTAQELCRDYPDLLGPLQERIVALQRCGWLRAVEQTSPIETPNRAKAPTQATFLLQVV